MHTTIAPQFVHKEGIEYLADHNGHIKLYSTRMGALLAAHDLKMMGYIVELKPGATFYRLKLVATPANVCRFPENCLCINLESPPAMCAYGQAVALKN